MSRKQIVIGALVLVAGYVVYRMFFSKTVAALTAEPGSDSSSPAASPASASNGNGTRARAGYRKSRRGSSDDWAPGANEFKTADVVKEADSVVENDDDGEMEGDEVM